MNNLADEDVDLSEEAAEYGKESAKSRAMTFYPSKAVKAYLDTLGPGMKSEFINNLIENFLRTNQSQTEITTHAFMALAARVSNLEHRVEKLDKHDQRGFRLSKDFYDALLEIHTLKPAAAVIVPMLNCKGDEALEIERSARKSDDPAYIWALRWVAKLNGIEPSGR